MNGSGKADYVITGRVPVLLTNEALDMNKQRAELILVFDNDHPEGYIAGARLIYVQQGDDPAETETIAKSVGIIKEEITTETAPDFVADYCNCLEAGTVIDFICDYYDYNGEYQDSYMFGKQITYTGSNKISDVYLPDWQNAASATYLFTDLYAQEYWTPVLANK